MSGRTFHNVRLVLAGWLLLLVAGAAFVAAGNVYVAHRAQQMREEDPRTYLRMAEERLNREDFAGALDAWDDAHALAPENAEVHKVHGDIFHRMGRWRQAVGAYDRAITLGSASLGVRLNILTSLLALEQYDSVARRGRRYLEEFGGDPYLHRYLAAALYRAERYREAVPHIEKALEAMPNDLFLMAHLARSYEEIGEEEKAQQIEAQVVRVQRQLDQLSAGAS